MSGEGKHLVFRFSPTLKSFLHTSLRFLQLHLLLQGAVQFDA